MFKKVLISEDFDIINSGLKAALDEMNISEVSHVSYCDEALLMLRKGKLENKPYDLLISDLSFVEDHNKQELTSGDALIEKVREEFPNMKIIVFSVEDKPFRIQNLYNNLKINAYVWKSRNGQKELKKAIQHVYVEDAFYISEDLRQILHPKQAIEITDYDVSLIEYLSKGISQEDICARLKEKGVSPCSISSVEKKIKFLKEHFNANNPAHLVAIAKDFGLI